MSNMLAKLWLQWRAAPLLSTSSQIISPLSCCMRPDCFFPCTRKTRQKKRPPRYCLHGEKRKPSALSCQLLSFSTSTEWYDRPASTKVLEPLFRRKADEKVGLVLQPVMHPLSRLKCLPQAALGCEAARLKPHLVLILCWCGATGTKPKVGERQADASEVQQSGKDQRGQRVPRRGTTMELEALVLGKSHQRTGLCDRALRKGPIRIWECGRNKEVGRFRASSNG